MGKKNLQSLILTTGLGAKNLGRNFIMMEQDPKYFEIAKARVGE